MQRALLTEARASAVHGPAGADASGWARLSAIDAVGPDATPWLQSQVTNDVEALAPGGVQPNARVTRTGHLVGLFLLVRHLDDVDGHAAYTLLLPTEDARTLHDDLDAFLFADEVTLTLREDPDQAMVSGPDTPAVLAALGLPLPEPAASVEHDGLQVIRLVPTGDDGVILLGDGASARIAASTEGRGLDAATLSAVVDALRQEAGWVRPQVDLPRKRLLPETGLEQSAVSYTKGCYLGQEVIARVRTYGSVPNALRALVLDGDGLDGLPEVGDKVVLDEGKSIGQAVSRTWSPAEEAPVLLAYLGRSHRTPGTTHTLRTPGGLRTARVALLPLHRAADGAARVQELYERGVRTFAEGRVDEALDLLEQALRIDAEHTDTYEALGVILARTERFHEAIDVFRRLEEVAPDEPLVNTNLSLYYMKIGDKSTAEEQAALAARKSMARGSGKTASQLAEEADQARKDDAARKERMFRQVLDFDPEDPIALFGLGTALSVLSRWEEAAEVLERARVADGKNAAVFLALGKALERLGRDAEAVRVYSEGMDVASRRGDLMPLREMEARKALLAAPAPPPP